MVLDIKTRTCPYNLGTKFLPEFRIVWNFTKLESFIMGK